MERIEDEDFETVIDEATGRRREILKDARRMRVPMMMADAAPPNMRLHDGRGGPVGHRPAFVYSTDAKAANDKQRAYDEYTDALLNAYKNPPTSAGSQELVGQREGDICTINGAPGHLQRAADGGLVCVPDRRQDARTVDARAAAYRDYDEQISNAWRG